MFIAVSVSKSALVELVLTLVKDVDYWTCEESRFILRVERVLFFTNVVRREDLELPSCFLLDINDLLIVDLILLVDKFELLTVSMIKFIRQLFILFLRILPRVRDCPFITFFRVPLSVVLSILFSRIISLLDATHKQLGLIINIKSHCLFSIWFLRV